MSNLKAEIAELGGSDSDLQEFLAGTGKKSII